MNYNQKFTVQFDIFDNPESARSRFHSGLKVSYIERIFLFLAFITITGCTTLPNVGPFVDATNQLRSAVATAGTTVVSELQLMPDGEQNANRLKEQWSVRNKAFEGLAAYSSSLKNIVDAGNEGAASAQKIADSVNKLAEVAGTAMPGSSEAGAIVIDITKSIYSQIAIARAAKSLEEAIEAAQPAIEGISQLIEMDLKDIDDIFSAASAANDNAIRVKFSDLIGYRKQLEAQLSVSDPRQTATLEQQVQLGQLIQSTDVWYSQYLGERNEVNDRLRAGRALILSTTQAASEWSVAHGKLLTAIKEHRPIDTESLIQAAIEINNLVNKVNEL